MRENFAERFDANVSCFCQEKSKNDRMIWTKNPFKEYGDILPTISVQDGAKRDVQWSIQNCH